jgi:hypothetical protein
MRKVTSATATSGLKKAMSFTAAVFRVPRKIVERISAWAKANQVPAFHALAHHSRKIGVGGEWPRQGVAIAGIPPIYEGRQELSNLPFVLNVRHIRLL